MGYPLQVRLPWSLWSFCCSKAPIVLLILLEFGALTVLASPADQLQAQSSIPPTWLAVRDSLENANRALINCKEYLELLKTPVCAPSELSSAIQDVAEAQLLIASDRRWTARKKATAAKNRNAKCLHIAASTKNSLIREDLLSMMVEADKTLEDVENVLLSSSPGSFKAASSKTHGPIHHDEESSAVMIGRDLIGKQSWRSGQVRQQQQGQQEAMNLSRNSKWDPRKGFVSAEYQSFPDLTTEDSRSASAVQGVGYVEQSCSGYQVDGTVCQFSGCAQGRNLVFCAIGFAKGVLGGYNGQWYTVTGEYDRTDNPPYGTLRYGLNLARSVPGGVWIIFSRDMTIYLQGMLWVHSHTTIDGRGFNIAIRQHSMAVSGAKQVILENIQVHSVRGGDTVHIFADCSKVWVDHVTSFGGDLGLISVVQGSTDVTISNCKLSNYNFNMLLGASDQDYQDKNMRVSVYRNHFFDSMQRMPHCRWGWCHVANNLYTNWGYYAIGARVNARVKTENNVFVPSRVNEVTPWHPGATPSSFDFSARIESKGDILMNGATYHQFLSATHDVQPPYPNGEYPPILPADKVRNLVSSCAGAQTSGTMYACWRASRA